MENLDFTTRNEAWDGAAEPQWDPLGFVFIFVDVRWVQICSWFQSRI